MAELTDVEKIYEEEVKKAYRKYREDTKDAWEEYESAWKPARERWEKFCKPHFETLQKDLAQAQDRREVGISQALNSIPLKEGHEYTTKKEAYCLKRIDRASSREHRLFWLRELQRYEDIKEGVVR